ncbi:uncharacterized protein LOC132716264 [Ruditapes philippinarum]|uniref:uncharacterized protein LOC132716264 n=1 Tax=Ruditapes philippinarum TaxID=129788 RepID=UPI00295B4F96|nr:uncharacterized protein LOC132716264 [Ruditapes philippinarum]XP_060555491.1 uncharacterized protein LOC132716264 [Ruditapes philippinarum]
MEKNVANISRPQSLLDQCTEMVATHLDQVESFVGLPSLIGERIFNAGCNRERFKLDVEYSTQAVRLFTDAYEEQFLSSLSVSGEHLGLNYCLEQILLFRDLVKLDMSYCGLGDDHEMLTQFQNLNRLEVFSLRGNVITNTGIQKMTAPYRMFNRGPTCLQILDLRDNKQISKMCLKYLTKFDLLNTVMFSELQQEKSKTYGCWTLVEEKLEINIDTVGWAKVLIDRWMLQARQKSVKSKPKPKTGAFSIRKCIPQTVTDVLTSSHDAGNQQYCDVIARRITVLGNNTFSRNKADVNHNRFSREHVSPECSNDSDREKVVNLYEVYGKVDNIYKEKPTLQILNECNGDQKCSEKSVGQSVRHSRNGRQRSSDHITLKSSKDCLISSGNANPFKMDSYIGVDGKTKTTCEGKVHSKVNDIRVKGHNLRTHGHTQKVKGSDIRIKSSVKKVDQTNIKISRFFTSTQTVQCNEVKPQCDDQFKDHKQCVTNDNQSNFTPTSNTSQGDADSVLQGDSALRQNINPSVTKSRKRKRIVIKHNPGLKSSFSSETEAFSFDDENKENPDNKKEDKELNNESLQKTKKFKSSLMQSLDKCF